MTVGWPTKVHWAQKEIQKREEKIQASDFLLNNIIYLAISST